LQRYVVADYRKPQSHVVPGAADEVAEHAAVAGRDDSQLVQRLPAIKVVALKN
jgi:hypothetical protein